MKRRDFLQHSTAASAVLAWPRLWADQKKGDRSNILWIMLEDWSTDLSCYNTKEVQTPNIDRLAAEGVRYTQAFTTAPVCSASRLAMLTGHYQNYTGTHQHRTANKKPLPYNIQPIPNLLQQAGYYTAKGCGLSAKTDHNFSNPIAFNGNHWNQRSAGQPFFAQVTETGTHRIWKRDPIRPIDERQVELPPYYPDIPMVRRDWANGLEQVQISDRKVGQLLAQLEKDQLKQNTIVILIGDHGRCMPRGKQFLYDPGLHIPLIIRWPGHVQAGTVCHDLANTLDICQTIVDIAGIQPPHPLHGLNLFSSEIKERQYIFAARDKMDQTHDAMRAVRSREFKYIENLMPERAYCQFNRYKEIRYPTLAVLNAMNLGGELNQIQAAFMASTKPEEELYHLRQDPWETNNLANYAEYAQIKHELRAELNNWKQMVKDEGISNRFRQGGWPSEYPTRSLEEWRKIVEHWKPWVFRPVEGKMSPPVSLINHSNLVKTSK